MHLNWQRSIIPGLWGKDRLAALVESGKLTGEQYEEITGDTSEEAVV